MKDASLKPQAFKVRTPHVASYAKEGQAVLLTLANTFIHHTADETDSAIQDALKELGQFAHADRSWVIEIENGKGSNTYEWCAPGIQSTLSFIQNLPVQDFPWISSRLAQKKVIHITNMSDLPADAYAERDLCAAQGLKSFLAIPIFYEGKLTGIVGFDSVTRERSFSRRIIETMQIFTEMLANALHRRNFVLARRESELRFRSVVDNLHEGVLMGDLEDRIFYANFRFTEMMGYEIEDMANRSVCDYLIPEEEWYKVFEGVERRKQGLSDTYEITMIRKNGTRILTEAKASPYRNLEGEIIGIVTAITDITARKRAESENQKLQTHLLQSQKMEAIGQLAAGVAHDLNNSLSAIVGHVEIIKCDDGLNDQSKKSTKNALYGCEQASNISRQLLAFARAEKSYTFNPICLSSLVQETVSFVRSIVQNNVDIRVHGEDNKLLVLADKSQLQQAITNMVINANHAMPDGGNLSFSFSTTYIRHPEAYNKNANAGLYVVLSIRDSGKGIDSEHLPRIFEPFYTTRKSGEGNGLGLSMVYGIMQNHGGWIEVDSEVNKGTMFSMYFPCTDQEEHKAVDEVSKNIVKATTAVRDSVGSDGLILVIDDEPMLAELACHFLDRGGFETKAFSSPDDAFAWYRKNYEKVRLILLDMKMPGYNGEKSFQTIRDINPFAKVILISGYMEDNLVFTLLQAGALNFIQKPVKYSELIDVIEQTLPKDNGQQHLVN